MGKDVLMKVMKLVNTGNQIQTSAAVKLIDLQWKIILDKRAN